MTGLEHGSNRQKSVQNWLLAVFPSVRIFILHHPTWTLMMCKPAMEITLNEPPKTTVTLRQSATKSSSTLEVISGDGNVLQGLCVWARVRLCVQIYPSPPRLPPGHFYSSVWINTHVKKSLQLRYPFPEFICNEDKNEQTKQIECSPTDLVLTLQWMENFLCFFLFKKRPILFKATE